MFGVFQNDANLIQLIANLIGHGIVFVSSGLFAQVNPVSYTHLMLPQSKKNPASLPNNKDTEFFYNTIQKIKIYLN